MTITKRTGLGRPMSWSELDANWDQVEESTAAAQQSAALAAASQAAAATSESNAAASASEASSQAAAAAALRTDLASTDEGKGLSLSVAEDGTTGQQFYDKADQFAGAYEDSVITITSVNRWITYNGSRWIVKPGTTVPFATTGLNATSWATDSANFIRVSNAAYGNLQGVYSYDATVQTAMGGYPKGAVIIGSDNITMYQSTIDNNTTVPGADSTWTIIPSDISSLVSVNEAGVTLPDTVAIFNVTKSYSSFKSRGFYSAGDGGGAVWNATGNTDASKAGTHVVTEAKVYNASGVEYLLDISSGVVNVLQNGAKGTTISIATTQSATDYVCLGEVVNGIQNQLPIPVETSNTSDSQTGINPLVVEFKADIYRIGRSPIIPYNGTTYNFNRSRMFVTNANADGSITGRLDGIRFGYDEIKARYEAVGDNGWWGSLSLTGCNFNDGMLYGDQTLSKAITDCYSGCGWLILNGQYNTFNRMTAEQFVWPAVTKKAEVSATVFAASGDFDDNDLDYRYICDFLGADRVGNFYGNNYNDCQLTSGRRGIMRDDSDWSYIKGGTCAGSWWKFYDTTNNPSGVIPSYFMVVTGTGKNVSGMYISANGSTGADSNPAKGVVYTSAKGHFFSGIYTEWSYCNFVISKYLWGDATDRRSMGLHIESVSTYKDNATQYMNVKFEDGSFGYYDSNGTWQWPDAFTGSTPTAQGVREFSIGTPTRDLGAFKHGGYDFKYATYNLWGQSGTADVDGIRGISTSKEMLNPFGLLVSSGEIEIPIVNPSMNSVIHVWVKDITGNFNPFNLVLWQSASLENPKENGNDFISYGETCIDYGNGYKLYTIANCRWNAFDGVSTWEASSSLRVVVDSSTPIIIKAVEAYSGGVSFFPQGCDYKPMSGMDKVFGETAYYGQENGCGGGIFWPGDIVDAYLAVDRHDINSPWLGSAINTYPKIVTGGFAEESGLSGDISATVVSSDSSGTIVTVPNPALLVAGGLVSIGGSQYRLLERIISGTTVTKNYLVQGYTGTAGASITISPVSSGYTFKTMGEVSADSVSINGGSATYIEGSAPSSATSSGVAGQIVSDGTYIYVCTATNTWVRTPITSW